MCLVIAVAVILAVLMVVPVRGFFEGAFRLLVLFEQGLVLKSERIALTLRKGPLRYHFVFFADVGEVTIANLMFMKQKCNLQLVEPLHKEDVEVEGEGDRGNYADCYSKDSPDVACIFLLNI